jgi:hypothetical protein
MRFIIHELPYEQPIVAGTLRYAQDGQPTGALEHYRVTSAVDGYRFIRVDLDARAAPSGRSSLYHLTLNPASCPEQLKYRFWADGLEVSGVVVWEGGQLTAARDVDGVRHEDEAPDAAFWFPSAMGLTLLRSWAGAHEVPGVTLEQATADPTRVMGLVATTVSVATLPPLEVEVTGEMIPARGMEARWGDQTRRVWSHPDGWPLKIWRNDGLTAVATQLVIYR